METELEGRWEIGAGAGMERGGVDSLRQQGTDL